MFQLKALFLRLYLLASVLISAVCFAQLWQGQFVYFGVLLIWLPLPLLQLLRLQRNIAWGEERETPLMLPALLGVAGVLLTEQHFSAPLWLALAGLFALLLYLFVMTATPMSVRERALAGSDARARLSSLGFVDTDGVRVSLVGGSARLVLFVHSAGPYSRMAIRQLQSLFDSNQLSPEQVVLVGSVDIAPLGTLFLPSGVAYWRDPQGQSCEKLGLLLRGGNWPLGDAIRPALAVVNDRGETRFWSVADNHRLSPCLSVAWPRLERALTAS